PRRAELALRFGRERRLVNEFGVKARVVEQREGGREQEGQQRSRGAQRDPGRGPPAGALLAVCESDREGGGERHERDPGRVLAGTGETEADARQQVVALAAFAQHAGGAEQRERQRRQRGYVVERQVRVEDGQEGDGLDRRREQPDRAAEQARTGRIQQPQGRHAEHGGGDARERVEVARVQRERVVNALRAA